MKNLYLFDIDGTLVDLSAAHLRAYKLSYLSVLHREVPDKTIIGTWGLPETRIHETIFKELGVPASSELIQKVIDGYTSNLEQAIRSTNIAPLSGVMEFLLRLKADEEYVAAITGNLEGPARQILSGAGLAQFFDYLVCDDGSGERKRIVTRAIGEAKRRGYDINKVIVIGDTTHDITAGKSVAAITVGVGTGTVDLSGLREENPDILLPDLTQYAKIFEALK